MTILIYKPKNCISDYPFFAPVAAVEEAENDDEIDEKQQPEQAAEEMQTPTIFSYLPSLFVRRMPGFQIPHPLPLDVAGLELLTQYGNMEEYYL